MIEKYAVIGNPIEHSKSPIIHQAFALQLGKEISYERVLAALDGFEQTVTRLIDEGYKGANVTVPFKFEAYKLCTTLSASARSIGSEAVNTLSFMGDEIHGDNTDGIGLLNDIEHNLDFNIRDKEILILGAGGAAHGVLNSMLSAKSITIANRTLEKASALAASVSNVSANAITFEALDRPYDLIVNATSAGLTNSKLPIPDIVFGQDCLAYDMMYGRETPFILQAKNAGARVADGLGMLVEQAAEAFKIWHGFTPDTKPVIAMLRNA
jgi:shikimate dehydrogenase